MHPSSKKLALSLVSLVGTLAITVPHPAFAVSLLDQDFLPFSSRWQAPLITTRTKTSASAGITREESFSDKLRADAANAAANRESETSFAARLREQASQMATARATPTPAATVKPTSTPRPTSTPVATATPRPSATPTPGGTTQCVTDFVAQAEGNQFVTTSDRLFRQQAPWNTPKDAGSRLRTALDAQRFGTGGKIRDIYTSGGDQRTMQADLEEYFANLIPGLEQQLAGQANDQATRLAGQIDQTLAFYPTEQANSVGSVNATRTSYSWSDSGTYARSFNLQKRGSLGLNFVTIARADIRITAKSTVSHNGISYQANYNNCNGKNTASFNYNSSVVVRPEIIVEYSIEPRGDSTRYLSGSFTVVDPQIASANEQVTGGAQR